MGRYMNALGAFLASGPLRAEIRGRVGADAQRDAQHGSQPVGVKIGAETK